MQKQTIVCDVGSHSLKMGNPTDQIPREIVPSCVGRTKEGKFLCGKDAIEERMSVPCVYPVERGVVRKWNEMEELLHHAFDKFRTDEPVRALLTEPPLSPPENKRKMLELAFESLNFDEVSIQNQSVLVLYAQGLTSGMVVDCGEGVTQIVPVHEGFAPHHLIRRHGVTGGKITQYLSKLLTYSGIPSLNRDLETIRNIKETLCFASCNLAEDRRLARETTVMVERYTLPDGTSVKVGNERFECTEAYFEPELVDMECSGLSDFVFDIIQECDITTRSKYYSHIVLSGGSSMFPGMAQRLKNDLKQRYFEEILDGNETRLKNSKVKIGVEAPSARNYQVFVGGCVIAEAQKDSECFWMTKADYDEMGIERALAEYKM